MARSIAGQSNKVRPSVFNCYHVLIFIKELSDLLARNPIRLIVYTTLPL